MNGRNIPSLIIFRKERSNPLIINDMSNFSGQWLPIKHRTVTSGGDSSGTTHAQSVSSTDTKTTTTTVPTKSNTTTTPSTTVTHYDNDGISMKFSVEINAQL